MYAYSNHAHDTAHVDVKREFQLHVLITSILSKSDFMFMLLF